MPLKPTYEKLEYRIEKLEEEVEKCKQEQKALDPERQGLEAHLQHSQRMDAIGTLVGGFAHEFNNILGVIIGHTQLAMDDVSGLNRGRYNLDEILAASLRAKDVVRQILRFRRHIEQGFKPVCLCAILTDSLKLLRASIPTPIEIRQKTSCGNSAIMADPTQIRQLLLGLCNHVAHAIGDKGGVLEIGLEDVEVDMKGAAQYHDIIPGNYLRLSVIDAGYVREPDTIEHILDSHFTTREVSDGSEMGLTDVYGTVKNHGGDLMVCGRIGKRSAFHVLFPVMEARGKSKVESSVPKGSERILFVDDEKRIVFAAKNYMEELGYEVIAETNPVSALEVFKQEPEAFDLVITDMTMPDMTGDLLAKKIMQIRSDMPVILCTGFSEQISAETAKEMGIKAYIMKPALVHEMATRIRQVLDQGRIKAAPAAKRILVVDDEAQMRSMIRRLLEDAGYEVSEAANGKVALWLYREKHPDLMITDLIMPEKEGIETIMEIKRDYPEAKVIAISGGGQIDPEAYLALAKRLGAQRTLAKPFKLKELLKAVKELL